DLEGSQEYRDALEVIKKTEQDVIPKIEDPADRRELEDLCRVVREAMNSGDKKKIEDASNALHDRLLNYAYLLYAGIANGAGRHGGLVMARIAVVASPHSACRRGMGRGSNRAAPPAIVAALAGKAHVSLDALVEQLDEQYFSVSEAHEAGTATTDEVLTSF